MEAKVCRYHHGLVIKEFRTKRRMSQPKLAERWPRSDGGTGVSVSYVVEVEAGRKHIDDQEVLRGLCNVLDIPLFRFGLSEYNPFDYDPFALQNFPGQGRSIYRETLDTAQCLVQQIWVSRLTTRAFSIENSLSRLNQLFEYFQTYLPPSIRLEEQYLRMYADIECLNGVVLIEEGRYEEAIKNFEAMYKTATKLGQPTSLAHSLMNLGVEAERKGESKKSTELLEQARDISFEASKPVIALVHSYLSRAYASDGDLTRFERATETAQKFGTYLVKDFSQDTDSVFYTQSDILAERSYGYLELGQPQKTVNMKAEITEQINKDNNARLHAWIPLDWARAYLLLNQIEKSVEEGREFFRRGLALQSPHVLSGAFRHLRRLEKEGFADVQAVRDFRDELTEAAEHLDEKLSLASKQGNE